MFNRSQVIAMLCAAQLLIACTAPFGLQARIASPLDKALRATVVNTESGQRLQILQPENLPPSLQNAQDIRAILDNSNSVYPVTRNADGTLSIPLPAGRVADSTGLIELLLSDNAGGSWLLRFDTGPLVTLQEPPFQVQPAGAAVVGATWQLGLNPAESIDNSRYSFNWFASASAQGPWQPLSGMDAKVRWTPAQPGNYFVRLDLRERSSGAVSTIISPAPVVLAQAADDIVLTTPADGRVLAGDRIELQANLPHLPTDTPLIWSYGSSPQGPWQPIAGQTQGLSWEPPAAGGYFLRLQVSSAEQLETYTSSRVLVTAVSADDVLQTLPASGSILRGESVTLSASLPELPAGASYSWSFAPSPQGPFTAISGSGPSLEWLPEQSGSFYLRLRVQLSPTDVRTYTSGEPLVSVSDSDSVFALSPQPANLSRGESVVLALRETPPPARRISWAYALSSQGPWQAITGQGQNLRWTPPRAGSYFLRAELSGGSEANAILSSASALVNVSENSNAIQVSPATGQRLGQLVRLRANLPGTEANARYQWFVGPSAQGPWQSAQTLDSQPESAELNWWPGQAGNYHVKVDLLQNQQVISFVSPQPLVFISAAETFFQVSPQPANISTQGAVEINAFFQPPAGETFSYSWSAAPAPTGPFIALGGSNQLRFNWTQPGQVGRYFLRLDARSNQSGRVVSFLSAEPLVTVGEASQATPRF
ncbi:MAG: hypothetical protein IGS03_16960 [Candidatus Sericytochromatia bacterium]|nr:hypothetical protein [Candidatus Sericytochromatia bacterium]